MSKAKPLWQTQGFKDQATYEAWCARQWADLDARQILNERARPTRRLWAAVAAEAEQRFELVEAFWGAVAAEAKQQRKAAKAAEGEPSP